MQHSLSQRIWPCSNSKPRELVRGREREREYFLGHGDTVRPIIRTIYIFTERERDGWSALAVRYIVRKMGRTVIAMPLRRTSRFHSSFRDGIDRALHDFARCRFSTTDRVWTCLCTRITEHRIDRTRHRFGTGFILHESVMQKRFGTGSIVHESVMHKRLDTGSIVHHCNRAP